MSYKVLRDGNGSSLIRVIGLGDYMPLKDHQAMVTECEEKSKAIFDIMAERDALAAQVNTLRDAINYSGAYKTCQEIFDALVMTPQQCLAEIKIEAAEVAYYNGFKDALVIDKPLSPVADSSTTIDMFAYRIEQISRHAANQYAAKVRQGEQSGTWLKDSNVNCGKSQGEV